MKVLECRKINEKDFGGLGDKTFWFLRVDIDDLSLTLHEILTELSNLSWLEKFDKEFLKASFMKNALSTCKKLEEIFFKDDNPLIDNAAEYIVSCLAKRAVVENLNHTDIPLAELLGRKVIGNPGFDFFTEDEDLFLIYCGEAKYVSNGNPYNDSLTQINQFIEKEKFKSDANLLNYLADDRSLTKLVNGVFGICSAFSATSIDSDRLIRNIVKNMQFQQCILCDNIIMVAVNIYEK